MLQKGKLVVYNRDEQGRILLYFRTRFHVTSEEPNIEPHSMAIFWIVEHVWQLLAKPPHSSLILILDRTGAGWSNFDTRLTGSVAPLQDYFPGMVHKIYVLGINWIFQTLYKIVSNFINPVTLQKISILDSNVETARKQLLEQVNPKCVMDSLGGSGKRGIHFPAFLPEELVYGSGSALSVVTPADEYSDKEKADMLQKMQEAAMAETRPEDLNLD